MWREWLQEGKSLQKFQGEEGGVAATRGRGTLGNRAISKDELEEVLLCDMKRRSPTPSPLRNLW